jgi:hypothetical protein
MSDGTPVTAENWRARRAEILRILQTEMYGTLPPDPSEIRELSRETISAADGVTHTRVTLELVYPAGAYRLPFVLSAPDGCERPIPIVTIGMSYDPRYLAAPPAELFRRGFAVAHVFCADITADGPGYADGLPALMYPDSHAPTDAAKLLIWGRCMSYVRQYLAMRGGFDMAKAVIAGCSRFGKTALAGGIFDEEFAVVASVCSGTAGTSIVRGKVGESVENIANYAPHWFCDKYRTYAGREDALPFDAHFIVAAIAPRRLLVTGAIQDYWCDPYHEFLACIAGSPAYELLGERGFVYPGPYPVPGARYPIPGDYFGEGNIGFAMREGGHGFYEGDWMAIAEFAK